jgi:hypothetical protein
MHFLEAFAFQIAECGRGLETPKVEFPSYWIPPHQSGYSVGIHRQAGDRSSLGSKMVMISFVRKVRAFLEAPNFD